MKKWAIWKTLSIVISSVILVSGMTVLGVYLAGGFKPKVVNPDSISFVLDDKWFNAQTNQFEVTTDFTLTIEATTSSADPITNNKVELSLDNGITYETQEIDENGIVKDVVKVRNDVISIPQIVTIGQPFKVSLAKPYLKDNKGDLFRDENGHLVNWITGGITTITATSQNKFIPSTSVKVAVDTPVYSISTKAVDFAGKQLDSVTLNENFTLQTTFFPQNSAYLFNDQANDAISEKRERKVFFESTTNNIVPHFDENDERYFTAADSPSENNTIMAYTFESARNQIDRYNLILQENGQDKQITYNQVVLFLKGAGSGSKSCELDVSIVKALIKNFNVLKFGQTMEMTVGKNFMLTMQSTPYADDFIGAQVISTNNEELLSMLKNVAICFEYTENDGKTWVDASNRLNIVGGPIVDYVDKGNRKFYFADTTSPNTQYAFWRLSSSIEDSQQFRMTIVLFVEGENGYEIFKDQSANEEISYIINLKAEVQKDEPVSWASTDAINITLDYDGDNTVPRTYSLSNLAVIPEGNVYKTVKFFARFAQGVSEETIKNILRGDPVKKTYNFGSSQPLDLYLVSNEITVYDTGEFELYFATIQTDSDGKEIIQDDGEGGKYVIVQPVKDPIKVNITKTLYQGSVEGLSTTTTANPTIEGGNTYYFNSGVNGYPATEDTITLSFAINGDSWGVFVEKVKAGRIQLTLSDGDRNINDFFDISDATFNDENHLVSYKLEIKDTFSENVDNLKLVKAILRDLDNSNLSPWDMTIADGNYYLYTPQPQSITLESDSIDLTQPVEVVQSLSNDGAQLTITYTGKDGKEYSLRDKTGIDEFIKLLKVTIVDQHNNNEIFNNSWSFGATDENVITINGKTFTFPTTDGSETTDLYVKVGSGDSYKESQVKITMIVSSTGIQKIESDQTYDVLPNATSGKIDLQTQTSLSTIDIQKYGASYFAQTGDSSQGIIDFYSLVALYYGEDGSTEYSKSNYGFKFSSQYLESLDIDKLIDLFGENGMIALIGPSSWQTPQQGNKSKEEYAQILKNSLIGLDVLGLKFNHNFAFGGEKLEFIISDTQGSGAVRISMNFTILANVSYASNSTEIGKDNDVFAMVGKSLNSSEEVMVGYKNADNQYQDQTGNEIDFSTNKKISELLASLNGWYIVQSGSDYKISTQNMVNGVDISIGEIANGKFKFYDFWEAESKNFKINFYLEDTENQFAPFYTFNFKVQRNIKVENIVLDGQQKTYKFVPSGSGSNNISSYIAVSRKENISNDANVIKEDFDRLQEKLVYSIQTNPYITIQKNGGDLERTTNIPVFGYNQTGFEYKISISIQESETQDEIFIDNKTLVFESGVSYQDIADRLTKEVKNGEEILENINAIVQNIDGIDYLKVTSDTWVLTNENRPQSDVLGSYLFKTSILYNDSSSGSTIQYKSKSPFYSFQDKDINQDILFDEYGSQGLFGLNDSKEYLIMRVLNAGKNLELVMLVPCVVSRIGTTYAYYDKFDAQGNLIATEKQEATLQDLISTDVKTLIENKKFKAEKAGRSFVIASSYSVDTQNIQGKSQLYYYSNNLRPTNITIEEVYNSYSRSNLANILPFNMLTDDQKNQTGAKEGDVVLQLNHLVGEPDQFAYVTLKATLTGNGFTQELYYIVRVEPNAKLTNVVYPYGDSAEYVISAKQQDGRYKPVEIKLDEAHNSTTCHGGDFRFNVLVNNERLSSLPVVDTIKSVSDGVNIYENAADYANLVDITFNDRENNSQDSVVTLTPKTDRKLTIVVSRNYQTVVGGQFDYTIIVNDESSNLLLEFEDLDIDGKNLTYENGIYKWTVKRANTVNNIISTKVNLRDRNAQGEGASSTLKYGLLSINPKGVVQDNSCQIYYNNKEELKYFNQKGEEIEVNVDDGSTQNAIPVNSNTLTLILDDYIDKDKLIDIYLYSQFGLLGQLQIQIEGSVTYTQAKKEMTAGSTVKILEFINNVKINGNVGTENGDKLSDYSYGLTEVSIQETKKYPFLKINDDELTSLSNTENVDIKLDIKLWVIVEGKEEEFSLILPLTINKNITNTNGTNVTTDRNNPFALSSTKEILAEDTKELSQTDIFSIVENTSNPTNQEIKFVWTAISGGNAFEEGNSQDKVSIQTKQVSTVQNCSALIQVSLLAGESIYSTFYVRYNFTVKPNVVVQTNAPAPQGQELYESDNQGKKVVYEYLQDGVSFANVLDDFINSQAAFVGENDIIGVDNQGKDILRKTNKDISDKYNRFVVYKANTGNDLISGTGNNTFTLNIISMQNADVYSGSKHYSSVGGNNTIYSNGNNVTNLTFKMGTWMLKEGSTTEYDWVDDGNQSRITLQLTCNSVTAEYTIILVKDLYGITFNRVNNNLDSTGSVESFYANNMTESSNIFEDKRMLNLSVVKTSENSNITSLVADKYEMLFEKFDNEYYYYTTKSLALSSKEIGQVVNVDLGSSFADYRYVGVYVEGKLASIGDNGVPSTGVSNPFKPSVKDFTNDLFNKEPKLLSRVQLTYNQSNVDFDKYAENLKFNKHTSTDESSLKDYHLEQGDGDLDKIFSVTNFKFKPGDGSNSGSAYDISGIVYSYKLTLDIQVKQSLEFTESVNDDGTKTPSAVNIKTNNIEAYTQQNLISTMGVYHPSTSNEELFKDSEFFNDKTNLNLYVVGLDKQETDADIKDYVDLVKQQNGFGDIKPVVDGTTNRYLAISAIQKKGNGETISPETTTAETATEKVYTTDYYIRGLGAKNAGNYVLLYMTYSVQLEIGESVNTYSKGFFIMMRVMPDYKIRYQKAGEVEPDENGIVSNQGENRIYTMNEVNESSTGELATYKRTILAGNNNSTNPIVSVKHKNDATNNEIAAQDFKYTLKIDDEQDGTMYNISRNVEKKLVAGNVIYDNQNNWTAKEEGTTVVSYTWQNSNDNGELSLAGAKEVKFGVQYFRFVAEDNYGYKFVVCFALSNKNLITPTLSADNYITEGAGFDIGVKNYMLKIETGEQIGPEGSQKTVLDIFGDDSLRGAQGENTTVLNLEGIEAFGFDKPFIDNEADWPASKGTYSTYFYDDLIGTTNGKNAKEYYTLRQNTGKEVYLTTLPEFMYLRVLDIDFLYEGKSLIENNPIINNNNKEKVLATDTNLRLKSTLRNFYRSAGSVYTMPALPGYIYDDHDEVEIDIVITLGYGSGLAAASALTGDISNSVEEEHEVHAKVAVRKSTNFISYPNNVVQDGKEFNVKDYVYVTQNNASGGAAQIIDDFNIYDDTLAVYIPANSSVTFEFEAFEVNENGKVAGTSLPVNGYNNVTQEYTRQLFTIQNTYSYDYVEYRSLSALAGRTLAKNYAFVINVTKGDTNKIKFKYNNANITVGNKTTGTGGSEGSTINISQLSTNDNNGYDIINVENPLRLSSNVITNFTQYYLISIPQGAKPEDDKTDNRATVEYRHTQKYTVTGYYYSLKYNYSGQEKAVKDYIQINNETENPTYVIPYASWTEGMYLTRAVVNNSSIQESNQIYDTFSKDSLDKLDFQITTSSSSGGQASGAATIDENGNIITNKDFNIKSHYITVVIRQKISGVGNDWPGIQDVNRSNYYNHTNSKILSLRLMERSESDAQISLSDLGYTSNQIILTQRVYQTGQIKYEEQIVNLPEGTVLANATVILKATTLWKNEVVDMVGSSNFKLKGAGNDLDTIQFVKDATIQITPSDVVFKKGMPLFKKEYRVYNGGISSTTIDKGHDNFYQDGDFIMVYAEGDYNGYFVNVNDPGVIYNESAGTYTTGNNTVFYQPVFTLVENKFLQEEIKAAKSSIKEDTVGFINSTDPAKALKISWYKTEIDDEVFYLLTKAIDINDANYDFKTFILSHYFEQSSDSVLVNNVDVVKVNLTSGADVGGGFTFMQKYNSTKFNFITNANKQLFTILSNFSFQNEKISSGT